MTYDILSFDSPTLTSVINIYIYNYAFKFNDKLCFNTCRLLFYFLYFIKEYLISTLSSIFNILNYIIAMYLRVSRLELKERLKLDGNYLCTILTITCISIVLSLTKPKSPKC